MQQNQRNQGGSAGGTLGGGGSSSGLSGGGTSGTGMSGSAATQVSGSQGTQHGAPDVTYNLISIVYHALQGAETYDQYIRDAEQSGNRDLAQFFREVHEENRRRAQRGQQLLAQQLSQQGGGRDSRRAQ